MFFVVGNDEFKSTFIDLRAQISKFQVDKIMYLMLDG